jgi:hypothetical protein
MSANLPRVGIRAARLRAVAGSPPPTDAPVAPAPERIDDVVESRLQPVSAS